MNPPITFAHWRRVAGRLRILPTEARLDDEVYEIECDLPGGLARRLVCNLPARVRSLLLYPVDWWVLDDAPLLALFDEPRSSVV